MCSRECVVESVQKSVDESVEEIGGRKETTTKEERGDNTTSEDNFAEHSNTP